MEGQWGLKGQSWVWMGAAACLPLAPFLQAFGSCRRPEGSEGGRARGLALRSEVLFSGGEGRARPGPRPQARRIP